MEQYKEVSRMSKVFDVDFRKGSFIEQVSKSLCTNTNGVFKKTEKGNAWIGGVGKKLAMPSAITLSRNDATIVIWFKGMNVNAGTEYIVGAASPICSYVGRVSNEFRVESNTNGDYWVRTNSTIITDNVSHCLVVVANGGTVNAYLDGVLYDTETPTDDITLNTIGADSGINYPYLDFIIKVELYNHAFSTVERNKVYQDFLNSQPQEKPVIGFTKNKPTDLSYEVDSKISENLSPNNLSTWSTKGTVLDKTDDYFETNNVVGGVIFNTTVGKKYRIKFNYTTTSSGSALWQGNVVTLLQYLTSPAGTIDLEFVATQTYVYMRHGSIGVTTVSNMIITEITGLVAAYNMVPVKGVLPDISGNGNTMIFDSATGIVQNKEGIYVPDARAKASTTSAINLGTKHSMCFRIKPIQTLTTGILCLSLSGSTYLRFTNPTTLTYYTGVATLSMTIPTISSGIDTYVLTRNGTTVKLYINGSLINTYTNSNNNDFILQSMFSINYAQGYVGDVYDARFYTTELSLQEAKDYHNSFITPTLVESFDNYNVGDTL